MYDDDYIILQTNNVRNKTNAKVKYTCTCTLCMLCFVDQLMSHRWMTGGSDEYFKKSSSKYPLGKINNKKKWLCHAGDRCLSIDL